MLTAARAAGLAAWAGGAAAGDGADPRAGRGGDRRRRRRRRRWTTTTDDDGLIEIKTTGQLFSIRHDLDGDGDPSSGGTTNYNGSFPNRVTTASGRMGCPTSGGCTGYELDNDLNFDQNRDGQITSADNAFWNSGAGWVPIGTSLGPYNATFDGNGYTISFLYIDRHTSNGAGSSDQALFGGLAAGKEIRNVGVKHAYVEGVNKVAVLVGQNRGTVTKSYATGAVNGFRGGIGGLVGSGTSGSVVRASYAMVSIVTDVSPACTTVVVGRCGGLVGANGGTITASWSAGKVDSTHHTDGLTGGHYWTGTAQESGTATNSYWDTQTSGSANSGHGTGYTTRALQRPTGYTGIYANWNLNLDGQTGGDDPWDFGTNREYPALKYTGRSLTDQRGPSWIEADHWGAPVVGEPVVAGIYKTSDRADLVSMNNQWSTTCDGRGGWDKKLWIWERSDNGRTGWSTVTSTGGPSCSFVYVPASADVGKYLRACVPRWTYGNGCTHHTAPVLASSGATAATATFASGNTSPVVGTDVVISALPRPRTDRTAWRWQRCTANDGTGCTLLAPISTGSGWTYTPVAADVGNYLRAFVYYSDSSGTWTRAETAFTGAVASN